MTWDYGDEYDPRNTRIGIDPPSWWEKPAPESPLPHNIEAEAALLGAMMIDNRLVADLMLVVVEEDFYEPLHGRIFRAIQKLHGRGKLANPVSLRPIFETDPAMKHLGGPAYLATLTGSGAALIGARDFADQVAELSTARKMILTLRQGIERLSVGSEDETPGEIATSIETDMWNAGARASVVRPSTAASAVGKVRQHVEQMQSGEKPTGTLCRTIPILDRVLGPAIPGRYHVIGGRPGMGKSVLLQSTAIGYALNGHPVEYFFAEMQDIGQYIRFVSDLSHWLGVPLDAKRIQEGKLSAAEMRDLADVEIKAASLPISFNPVGRADVRSIRSTVARADEKWAKKDKPTPIVLVDYIQILKATLDGKLIDDPSRKVGAISSTLGEIATDGHWVIALSQIGRHVEDRKNKRPNMEDLKLSGSLEDDADSVSFIYRDEYYLNKQWAGATADERAQIDEDLRACRGDAEWLVRKNRWGSEEDAKLRFIGSNYAIRGRDIDIYAGAQRGFDDVDDGAMTVP